MAKDTSKELHPQVSHQFFNKNPFAFGSDCYNRDVTITYDDIVDDSNFRPSSEIKRDMIASGNIGAGEQGVYDYQANEKITSENFVSDVEIALRQGKLDKADVQKLVEMYSDKAQNDVKTQREKEALEKAQEASKNRTKAIDEQLGINQEV